MTETRAIRIMLLDDHTLFRETLRRLLEQDGRYDVVAECHTAAELTRAVAERGRFFDLALVDYDLGATETGISVVRMLRREVPDAAILMVTAGMSPADLLALVRDLDVGVFLKSEPASELLLAMEKAVRGELWVSSGAALALLDQQDRFAERGSSSDGAGVTLTPRERSVMRRILEGMSNKEIGAQMGISESLVKSVIQRLFEKLGVRSRSQLVRVAIESQMDLRSAE